MGIRGYIRRVREREKVIMRIGILSSVRATLVIRSNVIENGESYHIKGGKHTRIK